MKQSLHHVGCIRTNHHELAVRHVDDAHQAVGNGQAQCHQQQNAAQADATEHCAQPVAPGQAGLHARQRCLQRHFHLRIGFVAETRNQYGLGFRILAAGQLRRRFKTPGSISTAQQHRSTHHFKTTFQGGHGFGCISLLDQRQARLVVVACQRFDGVAANFFVFAEQLERRQRDVELAAHQVGVDHVFGISGKGQADAAQRVKRLITVHDEDFVTRCFDSIGGQGFNEGQRFFIRLGNCCVQCLDARLGFTKNHGFYLGRAQRVGETSY